MKYKVEKKNAEHTAQTPIFTKTIWMPEQCTIKMVRTTTKTLREDRGDNGGINIYEAMNKKKKKNK